MLKTFTIRTTFLVFVFSHFALSNNSCTSDNHDDNQETPYATATSILTPTPTPTVITFNKTFGSKNRDAGYCVRQTTEKGFIVCGRSFSEHMILLKTDQLGNELWTKQYEGSSASIRETDDFGFILTGSKYAHGYPDILVMKTDGNGNLLWQKNFSGTPNSNDPHSYYDWGTFIERTVDGGYIVTGVVEFSKVFLLKVDAQGNEEWFQKFESSRFDYGEGRTVFPTSDGGFVLCGLAYNTDFTPYAFVMKTDSNGIEIWTNIYMMEYHSECTAAQPTSDGGIIACGNYYVNNNSRVFMLKLDSSGEVIWVNFFDSYEYYKPFVQETNDSGYVMLANTSLNKGDLFLVNTDSSGNELWSITMGAENKMEEGHFIQQTSDGGYIICGEKGPGSYETGDVLLIKTDENGKL